MKFKVGDIIKGKDNLYLWTNQNMTKGEVIKIVNDTKMDIKILEHREKYEIGKIYTVENTTDMFELICCKKITKQELFDMPSGTKIYTDAEDKDYQVWIKTSKKDFYDNNGNCIDEYDIEDNLTLDTDSDFGTKIIKIEKPTYETVYEYSKEVQEMTVAEIEKALGHAVKIIKEDK